MVAEGEQLRWRSSSHSCESGACVDVAITDEQVFLRQSTDPDGPWLVFSRPVWAAFLNAIYASEIDC
jgi:hypothetical protein